MMASSSRLSCLSKKKRLKPIEYLSPDKSVTVHVSANPAYGMATIWDADIMIYLASHLNELRERGDNDLSPTIRPVAMSLQHVAARQELRALMGALGLSGLDGAELLAAQ